MKPQWIRTPKAVVLDDDPAICHLIANHLEDDGFQVEKLMRIRELENIRLVPDVAVLDVRLREEFMTGFDAGVILKRKFPECQFVLISGGIDPETIADTYANVGFDFDFLAKPFNTDSLLKTIKPHLKHLVMKDSPKH